MHLEFCAERMPATVREWTDILGRIRFGTVKVAGKTYSAARIKLVAHRLATYADSDGSRIYPGIARLSVDLEVEYRTVRDVLSLLRRLGLIRLVRAAAGRGSADEYRLTLPTDLLDRDDLSVWPIGRHTLEVQRARDTHRGAPRNPPRARRGTGTRGTQNPAPAPAPAGTPGPQTPRTAPPPPLSAGSAGTPEPVGAGSLTTAVHGPDAPTTYQDRNTNPTDQRQRDLHTAVTLTRTRAPAPPPPNSRCADHGLSNALRDDGQPACVFCRRDAAHRLSHEAGLRPHPVSRPAHRDHGRSTAVLAGLVPFAGDAGNGRDGRVAA